MHSSEQGFLLVDVVVAATLITLAITALGGSFITSLRSSQYVKDSVVAGYFVEQKLEQLKSAAMSSELRDSDELLVLDQQNFTRQTVISVHPVYPALRVVTVTVSWWLHSRPQRVANSTYILSSGSALHP
jgi:type II secretory pathway pseudopilin PulG